MKKDWWLEIVLLFLTVFISAMPSVNAARFPTVGGDSGTWGTVLNDYLNAEHTANGTHRNVTIQDQLTVIVNVNITGNVGIGTSNPSYLLQVDSGTNGRSVNLSGILYVNSSTGTVGIGTTDPILKLHLAGTGSTGIRFENTANIATWDFFAYDSGTTPVFGFRSNNNSQFVFTKASDRVALAINTKGGNEYNNASVEINNKAGLVGSKAFISTLFTTAPDATAFNPVGFGAVQTATAGRTADFVVMVSTGDNWADNHERFRITNAGLVGIGINAPLSTLHINGSGDSGGLRVTNGTSYTAFFVNSTLGYTSIGTTTPHFSLDVFGKINSTAIITNDAVVDSCAVGEIRGNVSANKICLCTTANNWKCAAVS